MFNNERLTQVYQSAKELSFNNFSRIVLFSDCHRGDNSRADDFVPVEPVFLTALKHYYSLGYTYIELGDADELWQFRDFSKIVSAHQEVFKLLRKLQLQQRYYSIWGNHDIFKKDRTFWESLRLKDGDRLLCGFESREGIILRHLETGSQILLVHGHQVDPPNDRFWPLNCLLSRYLWRPLEIHLGIPDPSSPAKNHRRKNTIEKRIIEWVKQKQQAVIAGHTHLPVFPSINEPPYFNCGGCIHPDGLTAIEITNGKIALVKWYAQQRNEEISRVYKDYLAGPELLSGFFRKPFRNALP
ncbi:MAG: metallophosphoesterase [Bacillota bacterium]